MRNLVHRTYDIESIKNEVLNIGFSEEAIDFVCLHNDNYNYEVLKEKIIDVEKNLQKDISSLDTKIDNVEKTLQKDISSLNTKIDSVEKTLQKDIFSLDNKINVLKNELTASNRTIQ
ncbi:Bdr family repetitive protein, partial [Borreliella burgdorferi]|uniref:Bdr family repetitive protein n=1 Tax=Borreliella burgdorferi TaxID=139 RepID=UPI0021655981